jgi:heme exporter protein CcmD
MSHTPFIWASYLISGAVLIWVAVAPVLRQKKLVRQLKTRQARAGDTK